VNSPAKRTSAGSRSGGTNSTTTSDTPTDETAANERSSSSPVELEPWRSDAVLEQLRVGFQALVAGTVYGCLMKQEFLRIEAELLVDAKGNLRPEIAVRGLESGERLLIRVERVEEEA
jgi:hypothetical protein